MLVSLWPTVTHTDLRIGRLDRLKDELADFSVTARGRLVQGRRHLVVAGTHVGARHQQLPHDVMVGLTDGCVQWRHFLDVFSLGWRHTGYVRLVETRNCLDFSKSVACVFVFVINECV